MSGMALASATRSSAAPESGAAETDAAAAVAAVLSRPEDELDHARAKLTFDRIVDPSTDAGATMAELDRLTLAARALAGPEAEDGAKLAALRRLIHESGPWNGHRPFGYDHDGFKSVRAGLISRYLETRLGNCVSMPVLFLILADRLGLAMSLALAPNHLFLRHRDQSGRIVNLEATSGALPARDAWMREMRPMSDRAIASGLYMRALGRREGAAAMALAVVEHLRERRRFEEAVRVSEVLLRHNPRDGIAWANQGEAWSELCREMLDRYRSAFLIPLPLRPRYALLLQRNRAAFAAAEALGWTPAP